MTSSHRTINLDGLPRIHWTELMSIPKHYWEEDMHESRHFLETQVSCLAAPQDCLAAPTGLR